MGVSSRNIFYSQKEIANERIITTIATTMTTTKVANLMLRYATNGQPGQVLSHVREWIERPAALQLQEKAR